MRVLFIITWALASGSTWEERIPGAWCPTDREAVLLITQLSAVRPDHRATGWTCKPGADA